MNKLIEKLYEEMYSPKLTPQTLLSNLNLPNYTGVNFNKLEEYIVASTFCYLESGEKAEYKYYFREDILFKLESSIDNHIEVIYDRETEKKKLIEQITGKKHKKYA